MLIFIEEVKILMQKNMKKKQSLNIKFFLVEYQLFDDSNILIANTTVESSRSTTSRNIYIIK